MTDYNHDPQVGDIYRTSWGYDQTNVEFFQVVRRAKATVWLRAIAAEARGEGHSTRLHPLPGVWAWDYHLSGSKCPCQYRDPRTGETGECNPKHPWHTPGYSETGPRRVTPGRGIRIDRNGYIRHAYHYDMTENAGAFDTLAAGYPGH